MKKAVISRKKYGNMAELKVRLYLFFNGYRRVDSNFYTPYGELDIVAEKKGTMVFIEVRSRSEELCEQYGTPFESIDNAKKQSIIRSAKYYIKYRCLTKKNYRFDVIQVINRKNGGITLEHMENAVVVIRD